MLPFGPTASANVEKQLQTISTDDEAVNAFITVMADEARADAARLDKAAEQGQWRGVLHGMTIGVKDNIDTAGVRTTSGSSFFKDHVPSADATVIKKLKAAGAIIIGKLNMHEFAFGGTTQNVHYGSCHNPWNTDHIPGGSSGGSGAAVAAQMCDGSLGTDTGGSIRLPGAINGVVGLRPTLGRVSNGGSVRVSLSFDTIGPLAYRAEDVARILAAIEGYDANDSSSRRGPGDELLRGLHTGVAGVRIGIPTNFFFDNVDPEITTRVHAALETLESLGAILKEVTIPGAEDAQEQMKALLYADAAAFHAERLATNPNGFGKPEFDRLQFGVNTTGMQYAAAFDWRNSWIRQLESTFADVDIVASPATPVLTPPIEGADMIKTTHRLTEKTFAWSMGGNPALSVPVGFVDGLPVGMQLAGAPWRDGLLLRAAVAYQGVTDWHTARPVVKKSTR
jgi:aspartyl-tRNA(Asn)/glutamyl-tRNA(Gln) amidotransferase subunit A